MATRATATEPATAGGYDVITSCLKRVQRRLWLTRLGERCTWALLCAASVAVPVVGARLLLERYPGGAWCLTLLPAAGGILALWNTFEKPWKGRGPGGVILARVLAVMAILAGFFGIAILLASALQHLPLWNIPVGIAAVFMLAAALTTPAVPARAAAIFIDQQAGLQERVATALELMKEPHPPTGMEAAFRQPVIAAAVEACHRVRQAKVAYARSGTRLYAAAAGIALAASGITLLTPLPAGAHTVRQPYSATIDKSKKLEQVLNDLQTKKAPENPVAEKKLQPLKDALADLRKGNMSPFEADARLTQEKGDLQKSQEQMDASDKVERALENIKGMEEVTRAESQVKNAAMKDGQAGNADGSGKQDAQKSMNQAAKGMGDKMKAGGMSQAEKDKLAGDLQKAAGQAGGDSQLQKSLEGAAEAAKQGDGEKLAQNLDAAGERMGQQQAESQLSGEAVRQAMEAIDRAGGSQSSGGQEQSASGEQPGGGQGGQQGSQQSGQQNSGGQQGGQQQSSGQQDGGQQGPSGRSGGSKGDAGQQGQGQSSASGQSGGTASESGNGGSTNMHAPSGPGDHEAGHPIGGTGEFVKVYDEKAIASQGRMEQVSGKINPLGAASGTQQILGQGDKGDATIQTYESQLPAARKRALDDLQTQQIPPQYRDLIRNYYGQ